MQAVSTPYWSFRLFGPAGCLVLLVQGVVDLLSDVLAVDEGVDAPSTNARIRCPCDATTTVCEQWLAAFFLDAFVFA